MVNLLDSEWRNLYRSSPNSLMPAGPSLSPTASVCSHALTNCPICNPFVLISMQHPRGCTPLWRPRHYHWVKYRGYCLQAISLFVRTAAIC